MSILGKEHRRVDGVAKVTGVATYAVEFKLDRMTHGYLAMSTIAAGRIKSLDISAAEKSPGVLKVFTHENVPEFYNKKKSPEQQARDKSFRALAGDAITFNFQPIALVIAETFEQARAAASLIKAAYEVGKPTTDWNGSRDKAKPASDRPAAPRGDPKAAFDTAPIKIAATYTIPIEHHNPMELHGAIATWQGDNVTLYCKSQNVYGDKRSLATASELPPENVSVISPFVGGAFGSALRPNYYQALTAMASRVVGRPVKLSYTRRQMFTGHGYRPGYVQDVKLACDVNGKLTSMQYDWATNTSQTENYTEGNQPPVRRMYACPNVGHEYKIVPTHLPTPAPMRAPGMVSHMFALESAMDELAYAAKVDPLELRLINYAEVDPESGKPFSSKALKECYKLAAEQFGWHKRKPEPRSMRDGRLLVGWGVATGTWPAMQQPASVRVTLKSDGSAHVASATSDIGPGTYTVMTIIAAEYLGLPVEKVKFELGDTKFPRAPAQGGSFTTASVGTAIYGAAKSLVTKVLVLAQQDADSPLKGLADSETKFDSGAICSVKEPSRRVVVSELMAKRGVKEIVELYDAKPSPEREKFVTAAHGAQFIEVKVDPDLGTVRVTKVIEATACGKIMNPLASHSQEIGGVVWGIGMALQEQTEIDHRFGRIMNASLAEYHVPVNADVLEIKTMFVEEDDTIVNPIGVKGMGELGMVGIPAAIANAVFHATGIRMRDLPITPAKLLSAGLKA